LNAPPAKAADNVMLKDCLAILVLTKKPKGGELTEEQKISN
jgi:hypothetical protein